MNSQSVLGNAIYQEAKLCLDTHITLNPLVPPDVGCAEAVSFVLSKVGGLNIPKDGIAGTFDLYHWLLANSDKFELVTISNAIGGDIIISPSGMSTKGAPHGHVGILGEVEQGIMSNNSDTGLFMETWDLPKWNKYYASVLGFPVFIFRAK